MSTLRLWLGIILLLATLMLPVQPCLARDGDNVGPVILANRDYAPALLKGIREARKNITCCYYLFKLGNGRNNLPRRIAEELVTARRRGVEVTVYLENQNRRNRDSLDSANHQTAAFLSRGGVKVLFDSPNVTTHSKVTVIDDRYIFLGSHNLTQGALTHNNELSLYIDSPQLAAEIRASLGRL